MALDGTEGFLPDSEGGAGLHEGDPCSVRVTRAAQGGKGPRLTARLRRPRSPPARGPGALLELARALPGCAGADRTMRRSPPGCGRCWPIGSHGRAAAFDDEIEEQVEALAQPDVELPGGARLHIHPTPALVAIDVDRAARWPRAAARWPRTWR